jgi:hypothetical protein
MSKSTRLLVYSLPLLFAALAGFFFGRITSPGWQIVADGGGATKSSIVQASAVPVPQVFGPPHSNRTDGQPLESAIRHMADKLASEAQFDDMVQKLVEWAKTDPDAALNFAHGHFAGQQQLMVLTRMLSELAKTNPQAAWNWTFQKEPQNYQLLDTVLDEIGKTDSGAAWAYASQFAEKYAADAHNAYYGALRGMIYAGDYETAARLASEANLISPTNHDGDFPAMIASQWANYAPAKAADWLLSLPDGTSRTEALAQVGKVWSQSDPEAAADFAASLPAGETRRWVMSTAVGEWADADPVAAANWINQQEGGADFDQVIMAIATSPKADPATAVQWANSISVEELQVQTLSRIIQIWMGNDRAAATEYLQTMPLLSQGVREQVQERIRLGN